MRLGSLLLGFVVVTASLHADFSGPYAINPPANGSWSAFSLSSAGAWTISTAGSGFGDPRVFINAPVSLSLFTSSPIGNQPTFSMNLRATTTIVEDGELSFSYTLGLANLINDRGGYYLNGVFTQLTAGSGAVTGLSVEAGDVFAFSAQAGPQSVAAGIFSSTSFTISNFNVAAVPEPATAWFGLATLGACLTRRVRTRRG